MKRIAMLVAAGLLAIGTATVDASSFTTYCPGAGPGPTPPNTRVFWVTLDGAPAGCYQWADGNIGGVPGNDVLIDTLGWTGIDKDQVPDLAFPNDAWFTVSGNSFTVYSPAWSPGGFGSLAVAIKVGNNKSPDWAAFTLPAVLFTGSSLTGTWGTAPSTGGGLSHAVLYGKDEPPCATGSNCVPPQVPEPASMLLLGTGLLSAGFFRRKRK